MQRYWDDNLSQQMQPRSAIARRTEQLFPVKDNLQTGNCYGHSNVTVSVIVKCNVIEMTICHSRCSLDHPLLDEPSNFSWSLFLPFARPKSKKSWHFSRSQILFSFVTFWLYIFPQRKPWCRQASSCFYLKHVIEALKLIFGIISVVNAITTCASTRKRIHFWTFMDAFRSFRSFRRIVTRYNWTSSDAVESLSCLQICHDPKMLHKCDETSLRVTRIAVSRTPTWEVALTKIPFFPFRYYSGVLSQLIETPIDSEVTKSHLKGGNDIEFSVSWFQ